MRPDPISTISKSKSMFVRLKLDIAICTPCVEENPGFVACPPLFTAKGVRVDPRIPSCENEGQEKLVRWIRVSYNLTHVSGRARLHGASAAFSARKRRVRKVAKVFP